MVLLSVVAPLPLAFGAAAALGDVLGPRGPLAASGAVAALAGAAALACRPIRDVEW